MTTTMAQIACRIAAHRPLLLPPGNGRQASVAFILRDSPAGPEGLFIERAVREGDPWSGNLGLPGGGVEDGDGSLRETAERETWEEIGVDLSEARYLGRLSDIAGAHLPIRVACFVYGIAGDPELQLNHEVKEAFWVPVTALEEPGRRITASVHFSGRTVTSPAILLPPPRKPPLWGITYRLVNEFLEIVGSEKGQAGEGQ